MIACAWLRSRDARYTALVAILAILSLVPALVQPSKLVYPSWSDFCDLTLIHWPKALLLRQSLLQGNGWPLWSPYALSGQPLAANQLAMLFYPPALLLLLGPLAWAFSLFYALHLAWAGIGTYWLIRGLGRKPESALLGATIFALGGKLAAHVAVGHVSLVAAMAWMPWAFAFLHRTLEKRSTTLALAAWSAMTGVALAAQVSTHTYALIYTAYGLIVYAGLYLLLQAGSLRDRLHTTLRVAPRLALIPIVAIALGAAQLLPLLELAPYSNRALSLAEAISFSLSPTQTLTGILFPVPNVGHEWTIYPGLLTLGLAAGAWRARRQRPVIIFAVLATVGILLAMGSSTPAYPLAYHLLPGLRWMRTPARLWFFVTLALAVLAAYGFESWQDLWRLSARRGVRLAIVAGIGAAVALSLGVMLTMGQKGRGAWGLGAFGLLSGLLLLWATRRRPTPLFGWLALLLIVADLLSFDSTLLRFVPHADVAAQGRDAAAWLASQVESLPFRVYSPSYSLPQPAVSEAGLQQIDGVEPVHLTAYDRFMARAGGYGIIAGDGIIAGADEGPSPAMMLFSVTIPPFPEGVSLDQAYRDTNPNLRLLGLLNGRYLVAAFPLELSGLILRWENAGTWIYSNELALPRAFVVHQTEPVTAESAWQRLEALDPARVALVEGGRRLAGPDEPSPAWIVDQSPNRLLVATELASPGLLVLSETWYPGWQARDNGQQVPLLRTDAVLRGVYLEPGSHTVEFRYSPGTVWAGLAVTGCTTLALLVLAVFRLWRRA
jgi:hypothetical protein